MNYRHAFHAGNYADVLKHALLVALVRAFQRKEKEFLFVDTHAGRGRYDLSLASEGDTKPREPEWPGGIGKLWGRSEGPPAVRDYLGLIRDFDRSQGNLTPVPRFYPGSPRIAKLMARPLDRMSLWEKHPAECAALKAAFKGEARVSVHEADGYGAIRACLPPAERRALVLIDPPYEAAKEWTDVAEALGEAGRRFPSATCAVWFPITERAKAGLLLDGLVAAGAPALAAELIVRPGAPGMQGCAVVVSNPPWQFDDEARLVLGYLAEVLSDGSEGSVRWVVPR